MKIARKLFCAVLLLLFTSEYVAATTADVLVVNSARQSHLIAHEVQAHFSLLAEESEERDHRDSDLFLLERSLVLPFHVPFHFPGKLRGAKSESGSLGAVPRYTLHRSFLI